MQIVVASRAVVQPAARAYLQTLSAVEDGALRMLKDGVPGVLGVGGCKWGWV